MARRTRKNRRLSDLMNLGPATARRLIEAGIADEAALRRVGAAAAYRRVKHLFPRETTLVCLYALSGALAGVHWNRLDPALKGRLRAAAAAGYKRSRKA